jgi:hypothetical protein
MTTNAPTPPRWTMADLHRMARDQADEVSSLAREALALIRAGGSADRVSQLINEADTALDHLEAVNIDIESRLLSAIKRALRKNTGKPVRSRQAKSKPAVAQSAPTAANVLPFARRDRKNDPERPL